jgi:hypothetical protein
MTDASLIWAKCEACDELSGKRMAPTSIFLCRLTENVVNLIEALLANCNLHRLVLFCRVSMQPVKILFSGILGVVLLCAQVALSQTAPQTPPNASDSKAAAGNTDSNLFLPGVGSTNGTFKLELNSPSSNIPAINSRNSLYLPTTRPPENTLVTALASSPPPGAVLIDTSPSMQSETGTPPPTSIDNGTVTTTNNELAILNPIAADSFLPSAHGGGSSGGGISLMSIAAWIVLAGSTGFVGYIFVRKLIRR